MTQAIETVQAGDALLAVLDKGQGTPLVFVHGFPLDHSMWSSQIDHFSNRMRIIAPDLRGFGASSVTPERVTMEQFADDLPAMLDALAIDQPVVYCGLSMGGYIAWQFWRKHKSRVKALILCDTRAKADSAEAIQSRMKMVEHVLRAGTEYVADAMLPKLFAPDTFKSMPQMVEQIRQKILAASPQGIAAALQGMAARPDATEQLPTIDVPTLVIVGEHDSLSPPAEMKAVADSLPRAEFLVIPNAGHMTPLENPQAFNTAIEKFLRAQKVLA